MRFDAGTQLGHIDRVHNAFHSVDAAHRFLNELLVVIRAGLTAQEQDAFAKVDAHPLKSRDMEGFLKALHGVSDNVAGRWGATNLTGDQYGHHGTPSLR